MAETSITKPVTKPAPAQAAGKSAKHSHDDVFESGPPGASEKHVRHIEHAHGTSGEKIHHHDGERFGIGEAVSLKISAG
jgi:hypothetical protein